MHLYVHVPFCARRCSYCDFAIAVRREVPSRAYVDAVLAEWRGWQDDGALEGVRSLRTVYFGGGTPSKLAAGEVARLLDGIRALRPIEPDAEITLEANPEDVSPSAVVAWRGAGVNRVSLGVQSFQPAVLAWMHRTHDLAAVHRAVATLREGGIGDLSLDLIFAAPESLARDWAADLDAAVALAPEHLSVYGLTVEPGTPLGRWTARAEVVPAPDERYAAEFLLAHERLTAAGYGHYEVSNYGRAGFRARHNSAYWRRAPFIGLGPSAHSGFGRRRRWNLSAWAAYERAATAGRSVVEAEEQLDDAQVRLEELYLGLRTLEGLPAAVLGSPAAWRDAGWAELRGDRIVLTAEGWLRLDALVRSAA
jgi:oxygen-independent coproporphyrinogen III oxidase